MMIPVWLMAGTMALAQVAEKANSGYKTQEGRERVGRNMTAADRDARQLPNDLISAMGIKPGMTVADIGTGPGYMLPFLSRAVGAEGKVIAEDIFPDFLEKAAEKASREKLGNVSFVKGTDKDPNFPAASIDVALTLDSYHHWDYPPEMLAGLRRGLKAGGRLVVVDFYKRPGAMGGNNALDHIRIDEPEVIREIEANGFKLISKREHVKGRQYMIVFGRE
ncbi:MAG: methyltransferase domain-containing protein [Bryobacteraceae bacterium]